VFHSLELFDFSKEDSHINPRRIVKPILELPTSGGGTNSLSGKVRYIGEWDIEEGEKDGRGVEVNADGELYEGYFLFNYVGIGKTDLKKVMGA
jgi:hypothetical protein